MPHYGNCTGAHRCKELLELIHRISLFSSIVILIVGTVGNGFVIYKNLIQYRKRRHSFHLHIISQAIADFIGSGTVLSHYYFLTRKISSTHKAFLIHLIFYPVSSWMMVSMAVVRYRIIVKSGLMIMRGSKYCDAYLILQAWIVGITFLTHLLVSHKDEEELFWNIYNFVWWWIPLVIVCVLSFLSYHQLKLFETQNANTMISLISAGRNKKVAKTFLIVIITFFIMGIPFTSIHYLYHLFKSPKPSFIWIIVVHMTTFIFKITFITNPFIYNRHEFQKMFRRLRSTCNKKTTRHENKVVMYNDGHQNKVVLNGDKSRADVCTNEGNDRKQCEQELKHNINV